MKKNILNLFISLTMLSAVALASDTNPPFIPPQPPRDGKMMPAKPSSKEIKKMDKMIEERLNLTDEQIKILKANRQKNVKELEKIVSKMDALHKKIRNIYLLGLPTYQADIKSAPYKMELVILKQNADMIRNQNRKTFESVLTPEQKAEFKKFKSELPKNRIR